MRNLTLKAGLTATLLAFSIGGAFAADAPPTELQREALENHGLIVPPVSDQTAPTAPVHGYAVHAIHPVKPFMGRTMSPPYPGEPRIG